MIIAVDLDGVVFDTENYYRTYSHLYDIALIKNGMIDGTEMGVHKRYGWNNDQANEFYEKYTAQVLSDAPFNPGARYVLRELKKQGHTLICVTLRGYYRQCEIDITEQRLKENNIVFDKIIYNQSNKLEVCLQEKIDLIIDDNPKTIQMMAENNIKCLHFKGAGLKSVTHPNVVQVQNWGDVYENILKLK